MNDINEETTIARAILLKGSRAGKVIDNILCNGQKNCCPGTSLKLGAAAKLMEKSDFLIVLLQKLNRLPNHSKCTKKR